MASPGARTRKVLLAPPTNLDEPKERVSAKGKLLLVEDSEAQGAHIRSTLERQGYEVHWAQSGIEGLKMARTVKPDLIVLDVVMQDMDGLAVCRWLKMSVESRDIPIIMLTVRGDLQERVEGLNIGADDYLPKPFADEELDARIFAALRVKSTKHELERRNSELQSMLHHVETLAITDPLTGLFNRRRFDDVLKREFAITKRYSTPLSCLMVDVDHFKRINDLYGHDAGDRVLCGVANRVAARLREVDTPARFGGEEFAVLLPQTPKQGALVVAERIAAVVRREHFEFADGSASVTVSVGVADSRDVTGSGPDALVKAADTALYQAKSRGRDQVVAYSPQSEPPPAAA
jgi:two-component system cell cycle response regulator